MDYQAISGESLPVYKREGEDILGGSINLVSALEIDREEAGDEIWLFQFVAKAQKMDLIIRQATEVGVSYIVPVQSAFSVLF